MPVAKVPRTKICKVCQKGYPSIAANEKVCPSCRPAYMKAHYRMNVKRWRERKSKEELKAYRHKEYITNYTSYKRSRDAYTDKVRFGGLRQQVLERDGFKCVKCGSTEKLSIDHINGVGRLSETPDNRMENLQTLCLSCHAKKDGRKNWFKKGHS